MSEIDQIKREAKLNDQIESVKFKMLQVFDKRPDLIHLENFDEEQIEYWIKYSLEKEFYNVTALFKAEQEKRKINN